MSSIVVQPRNRGVDLKRMTDAQRVFCLEYIANGAKVADAARVAYPKSKNPSSAGTKALNHPLVKAYLGKVLKDKLDQSDLSADRLLKHLATALFLDPLDMFETISPGVFRVRSLEEIPESVRRCITKVKTRSKTRVMEDGLEETETWVELELMSKDEALGLAMKFRGLLQPDQNTTNVNLGVMIDFDELCSPPKQSDVVEGRIAQVVQGIAQPPSL